MFSFGFFNSLTLSAYLKVFKVCSLLALLGEIFPIITVLQFPVKLSFKTRVSLLPLKGVWFLFKSMALMHSFNARRDLLISAPSILVCLFWSDTSAPLSLPAKSMNDNFPCRFLPYLRFIWSRACERELSELAELEPTTLLLYPNWIICINY